MNLSKQTSNYIGLDYDELTCVDMVRKFIESLGFYFPTRKQIEDLPYNTDKISVDNHMEQFIESPIKMQALMIKLFLSFYDKVDNPSIGDIVITKAKEDGRLGIWPSVYIGKSLVIASFIDVGVITYRYKMIGKPFLFLSLKKEYRI